jgi:hypothetical protein
MARIKVDVVIGHLEYNVRRALEAAVREVMKPEEAVNSHSLFRAFRRALHRKCSTWERVPDSSVEAED